MAKILKWVMTILIILGISLSVLHFIAVDSMAITTSFSAEVKRGTPQENGDCDGDPFKVCP